MIGDMKIPGTIRIFSVIIASSLILSVWLITYLFGPIDTYPRIYKSFSSPDDALSVAIYRRRVHAIDPLAPVDVLLRVHDAKGHIVYEERLYELDMWDDLKTDYDVTFEPEAILFYHLDYHGQRSGLRIIKKNQLRINSTHNLHRASYLCVAGNSASIRADLRCSVISV